MAHVTSLIRASSRVVAFVALAPALSAAQVALPGAAGERARLAALGVEYWAPASPVLFDSVRLRLFGASATIHQMHPTLAVTWNSAIPYSMNDGTMWAGRGASVSATAGLRAHTERRSLVFSLALAPEITYSQNLPFQIIPDTAIARSAFASPFHHGRFSVDLPLRFGDRHLLRLDPGRSGLSVSNGAFVVGATAGNETWGPGVRNQLVMSANAPGVPRVYIRTARPMHARLGYAEATIFSGALTESPFFDRRPENDVRSISGFLLKLRPAFDSGLAIGVERVVFRPIPAGRNRLGSIVARSFDALLRWEYSAILGDTNVDGSLRQKSDQIAALFFQWVFRDAGFEVYGEWARLELPYSDSDVLAGTGHSLGYTLGFQWAHRRTARSHVRLQAEITNLEQTTVFPDRPSPDFYTGRASPQGYTNRGQVLGAAVGPGASSQWVALDRLAPRWQIGAYVGRIRWETDAMYRQSVPTLFMHDVTVFTGLRGGRQTRWLDVGVDATFGYRFNYLFQNGTPNPGGYAFRTVDIRNMTLATVLTPR